MRHRLIVTSFITKIINITKVYFTSYHTFIFCSHILNTNTHRQSLKVLLLNDNAIQVLPDNIGGDQLLTILNLCNNKLSAMPADMRKLRCLGL